MKTKKEVIKENSDFRTLINATINGLGDVETVKDVNSHGMAYGFGQFVYYYDTHKFAIKYRKQIVELLESQAFQCGLSVYEMVSNFRSLDFDTEDRKDFFKYMAGSQLQQGQLTNVMCWFAVETVCSWFDN